MSASLRAACFVDRDGTVMVDTHYPSQPGAVRLLPGVPAALRQVREAGVPIVIVTNQGGIARGYLTEAQYQTVRARLDALLAAEGITPLATYHCPHYEPVSGPCDCRKPATGMYRRAAAEHGLDLTRSIYIGDRFRDVQPAITLGGFGVLVPGPDTPDADIERARSDANVAPTLGEAIGLWLPMATASRAPSSDGGA
ncbi:MAG TPA: HAD family hydrolase [Gemmatimonadaceae bacterium]|nr:HAD family hydrolase [Gemmatimonadaceae bacterium]